jgi:hypothetical protein
MITSKNTLSIVYVTPNWDKKTIVFPGDKIPIIETEVGTLIDPPLGSKVPGKSVCGTKTLGPAV